MALTPLVGSPADLEKLIADETEKWAKVIRAANIKPNYSFKMVNQTSMTFAFREFQGVQRQLGQNLKNSP